MVYCAALPGMAAAQDTRMMRLLSEDFAETARQNLAECDRSNAIIAALRGLPTDPTRLRWSCCRTRPRRCSRRLHPGP